MPGEDATDLDNGSIAGTAELLASTYLLECRIKRFLETLGVHLALCIRIIMMP